MLVTLKDVRNKSLQTYQEYAEALEKMGLRTQTIFAMLYTGLQNEYRKKMTGRKSSQATQDLSNSIYANYYKARKGIDELSITTSLTLGLSYQKYFIENMTSPIGKYLSKLKESPEILEKFEKEMKQLEVRLTKKPPEEWTTEVIKFTDSYSQQ